jgi:hypothetical protein
MITIFVSVIAQDFTVAPLSDWYGRRFAELEERGAAGSEMMPVPEMPTRVETAPVAISTVGPAGNPKRFNWSMSHRQGIWRIGQD